MIIPVWRDESELSRALRRLHVAAEAEVIVACVLGEEWRYEGIRHLATRWVSAPRGRAVQMNAGASVARGRWLLFLHADSTLPRNWIDVVIAADRRESVIGGSFTLGIDHPAWQARAIEAAVRLRVALLRMPYGDQVLFVRKHVFDRIGGYRDLPLMEDIDLVRRLKRAGPLVTARSVAMTSARRWSRDGWFGRSSQNVWLATRFLLGVRPARLAQVYFRRKSQAVVLMARAPWVRGKTRLAPGSDERTHRDLREALFFDTLDVIRTIAEADHIIACEPADACHRVQDLAGPAIDVIAQRGDDLGQRLAHVFEDTFRLGSERVVVIGSDLPDLPNRLIDAALAQLRARDPRIVLGPATDGGYYLVGLNRPCPAVFERVDWSTTRVLAQTVHAAETNGLRVLLLDEWTDVDSDDDLQRLIDDSPNPAAARTRAWARQHMQS